MKIDVSQKILNLDGSVMKKEISQETANAINVALKEVQDRFGMDAAQKVADGITDKFNNKCLTYKDCISSALMISDQGESGDDKMEAYEMLKVIFDSKVPDIGKTEGKKIYEKIKSRYNNTVIIGRCRELLVDSFKDQKSE